MREALRPPPRPSLRLADRSFTDEATLAEALRKGGPKMHAELADNLPELVEWAWTGPRGDPVRKAVARFRLLSQEAGAALLAAVLAGDGRSIVRGLDFSSTAHNELADADPGLVQNLFRGDALAQLGRFTRNENLLRLAHSWRILAEKAIAALPSGLGEKREATVRAIQLFTWRLTCRPGLDSALKQEYLNALRHHPGTPEAPWVQELADPQRITKARAVALIAALQETTPEPDGKPARPAKRKSRSDPSQPPPADIPPRLLAVLVSICSGFVLMLLWSLWGRALYENTQDVDVQRWWLYPFCQAVATVVAAILAGVFGSTPRFSPWAATTLQTLALLGGFLATGKPQTGTPPAVSTPSLAEIALAPGIGCLLVLLHGLLAVALPAPSPQRIHRIGKRRLLLWLAVGLPGAVVAAGWASTTLQILAGDGMWPAVITAGSVFAWWVLPVFVVNWLVLPLPQFRWWVPVLIGLPGAVFGILMPGWVGGRDPLLWLTGLLCRGGPDCAPWPFIATLLLPPWWPFLLAGVLHAAVAGIAGLAVISHREDLTPFQDIPG